MVPRDEPMPPASASVQQRLTELAARGRVGLFLALVAMSAAWHARAAAHRFDDGAIGRQGTLHRVFLTAVDESGQPVTDLAPDDLAIKEDGRSRRIEKIQEANGPLSIALLVDDNGVGINDIRVALAEFIQRLQGLAEIALSSIAPTTVKIVDFTTDGRVLIDGVRSLVGRASPRGGHLVAAISDAASDIAERKAERKAIIVITFEGDEYSTVPADQVLSRLSRSQSALHVIAVGKPSLKPMAPFTNGPRGDTLEQENNERGKVLSQGPRESGGRRRELVVTTGLPKELGQIADELTHQYSVLYETDEGKPAKKLTISTRRRGVTIVAPTRLR